MDYVGLLDVSGIQSFIGEKHELKEIAGRSRYIAHLTEDGGLFAQVAQETGVEPIVLAGGNAAFRSRGSDGPLVNAFRMASRKLIADGTGLEVIGAIHGYEPGALARSYGDAIAELERRKLTQPRNAVFTFSGMERPGPYPPMKWEAPDNAGSSGLREPVQAADLMMCGTRALEGERPRDERFDVMGVVSIDGLGMGQRLITWLNRMAEECPSDDAFAARFRAWSSGLQERWDRAWGATIKVIEQAFPSPERSYQHPFKDRERVRLQGKDNEERFIPCRRIYQGGDDMIFVADGRLALSLASLIEARLRETDNGTEEEFRSLRVSVGVAFVDSHYPFSRARTIADKVRVKAKKATVKRAGGDPLAADSAISWWVNRQGALDPVDDHITMKPYVLADSLGGSDPLTWSDLEQRILGGMWRSFAIGRNKLKDILVAADRRTADAGSGVVMTQGEAGAAAVRALLQARPLDKEQSLDWLRPSHEPDDGFDEPHASTPLLDAGELFDIHWPLKVAE